MSSKQTRRSISVRGTTYDALRRYCDRQDRSMSDVVEELLAKLFDEDGARTIRARPMLANKVARATQAAAHKPVGRPAPTPADKVVPERVKAPKGDYRTINF